MTFFKETSDGFWVRVMWSPNRPSVWLWEVILPPGGPNVQPTHGAKACADFGEAPTQEEANAAADRALAAMRVVRQNAR